MTHQFTPKSSKRILCELKTVLTSLIHSWKCMRKRKREREVNIHVDVIVLDTAEHQHCNKCFGGKKQTVWGDGVLSGSAFNKARSSRGSGGPSSSARGTSAVRRSIRKNNSRYSRRTPCPAHKRLYTSTFSRALRAASRGGGSSAVRGQPIGFWRVGAGQWDRHTWMLRAWRSVVRSEIW